MRVAPESAESAESAERVPPPVTAFVAPTLTEAKSQGRGGTVRLVLLFAVFAFAALAWAASQGQAQGTGTGLTSSEREYVSRGQIWSRSYSSSFSDIGALLKTPHFNDVSWAVKLASAVAAVRLTDEEVQAYTAPSRFTDTHISMKIAASHFDRAMGFLVHGLDNQSASDLRSGSMEMSTGISYITEATDRLNKAAP